MEALDRPRTRKPGSADDPGRAVDVASSCAYDPVAG
jgi:hypothetical protein